MQKLTTTILILLCFAFGCINEDNYIKDVYVNIEIAINQPQYSDLNAIGNSIFITGGVRGIIIYHKSLQNYVAFDRNCSFEPSSSCSIIDSISSTIAYCGCCESKFLIDQDGITANGPALLPLKEYQTFFSNGVLRIQN